MNTFNYYYHIYHISTYGNCSFISRYIYVLMGINKVLNGYIINVSYNVLLHLQWLIIKSCLYYVTYYMNI